MLAHEKGRFVLSTFPRHSGFTLVELLIVITILAIATSLGIPSYRTWVQNTQIRNAAESVQNGLQRARAEAIALNTNVEFVLLGTSPSWVSSWEVRAVNSPVPPIDSSSGTEGSKNVTAKGFDTNVVGVVGAAATVITFSSLGTVVTNTPVSAILRRVELDSTVLTPADSRDLRVTIGVNNVGSNVRMCDPNLAAGSSPQAC